MPRHLYPLVIDALNLGKLSVGLCISTPCFIAADGAAAVPMAVGPVARWKQANLADIVRPLRFCGGCRGRRRPVLLAGAWSAGWRWGLGLAIWIVGASVVQIMARPRPARRREPIGACIWFTSGSR